MDSKIPTSFIPKESLRSDLRERREPTGILSVIALIILAGSLVYLAGTYVYRQFVYNEITRPCSEASGGGATCGLRASLEIRTRDLERGQLEELKRLDTKLKNGASILNQHITLKPLFDLLSLHTNQNIQYQKFQFASEKNTVTIEGVAKTYEDIAFQQKVFTGAELRKNILSFSFSDFDINSKGEVTFKLVLNINPALLAFNQSQ